VFKKNLKFKFFLDDVENTKYDVNISKMYFFEIFVVFSILIFFQKFIRRLSKKKKVATIFMRCDKKFKGYKLYNPNKKNNCG